MKETLRIRLQEEHYKSMLERYHFRQTDLEQLRCLGEILLRTAEPVMYCEPCRVTDADTKIVKTQTADARVGTQLAVIVSLGAKVDALQNEYINKERLTEGYMIECIGMELLKAAYELTAERIWKTFGLWIGEFAFLGERYPLELTEDVFRLLAPEEITYNQAYMLTPKKTVAFMTTLQKERKGGYCHICDACSNLQCPNRQSADKPKESETKRSAVSEVKQNRPSNLNYGYQRIFGKP